MNEPTTERRFHMTDGAWDAMNAALSRTFPIYDDPEAGTDIDGDVVAVMDALRDYNEGYVVVPLAEARASLDVERLVRALLVSGWAPPLDDAMFGRYSDPRMQFASKVAAVAAEYDRLGKP